MILGKGRWKGAGCPRRERSKTFGPLFRRLIVTVVDLLLVLFIFPSRGLQGSARTAHIRPQRRRPSQHGAPAAIPRGRSAAQHGLLARSAIPAPPGGWPRCSPCGLPVSEAAAVLSATARLGSARAGSRGGAEAGGCRHGLKSRGRKLAGESHEPAAGQPARQRAAVRRLQPGPR